MNKSNQSSLKPWVKYSMIFGSVVAVLTVLLFKASLQPMGLWLWRELPIAFFAVLVALEVGLLMWVRKWKFVYRGIPISLGIAAILGMLLGQLTLATVALYFLYGWGAFQLATVKEGRWSKPGWRYGTIGTVYVLPIAVFCYFTFATSWNPIREYAKYLWINERVEIIKPDKMIRTAYERAFPRDIMREFVKGKHVKSNAEMTSPDVVLVKKGNERVPHWVLWNEPIPTAGKAITAKWFGSIEEIVVVPVTKLNPVDHITKPARVVFEISEHMYLGKSVRNNVRNRIMFSSQFWKWFSINPEDVRIVPDDNGNWVMVVSVMRWSLPWMWPEFDGVMVIQQHRDESPFRAAKRYLLGEGTWISAQDIENHKFLQGQALVPKELIRYAGELYHYSHGFWSATPIVYDDVTTIADIQKGGNRQPYVTYCEVDHITKGKKGTLGNMKNGLYFQLPLEAAHGTSKGAHSTLYFPGHGGYANGKLTMLAFPTPNLTGISSAYGQIKGTRPNFFNTDRYDVDEFRQIKRPYKGKTRIMYFVTVVDREEGDGDETSTVTTQGVSSGVNQYGVFYDPDRNLVAWVEPDDFLQFVAKNPNATFDEVITQVALPKFYGK